MNTVQQYKCNNCGAPLSFSAESQSFKCTFCKSTFTQEELDEIFLTKEDDDCEEDTDLLENMSVYHCDSCGAEITSDDTTAATFCHYCHAPVILKNRLSGTKKPKYIIPFFIQKENAIKKYRNWLYLKLCAPSVFYKIKPEQIKGTYVPFWIYTCTMNSKIQYECYDCSSYHSGDYLIKEKKFYTAYRDGFFKFDKVPSSALTKTDGMLLSAIEPFNYMGLKPFSMAYLSGYLADKYNIDSEESFKYTHAKMMQLAKEKAELTICHKSKTITHNDSVMENLNSEYALFPVWYIDVEYKNEKYTFAVNAQTGKVAGKLPFSIPKAILVCLLATSTLFSVITFMLYNIC